jgi:hypothetical protein
MSYTDIEIDIGVTLLGSGYRVDWDDVNRPYWLPVPESVLNQDLYVVDWDIPGAVRKFKPEDLNRITRSGEFLDKAFTNLESIVGEAVISELLLYDDDVNANVLNYIVSVGGITTVSPALNVAKWEACGLWAMQNIEDALNPTYLYNQVFGGGVFVIDENTFLIL